MYGRLTLLTLVFVCLDRDGSPCRRYLDKTVGNASSDYDLPHFASIVTLVSEVYSGLVYYN